MIKSITHVAILAAIGFTFYANLKKDNASSETLPVVVEDMSEWPWPIEPVELEPVSVLDHLLIEEDNNGN